MSFFFIIKQALVLYNYHENIKALNPRRNALSVYSETVHLNEPSGCDVTTMQSPPSVAKTPTEVVRKGH